MNKNKITKDLIDAVQWIYGFNKKEAIEYIKTCNSEMIENIYFCYLNNLNKAFYNDQIIILGGNKKWKNTIIWKT